MKKKIAALAAGIVALGLLLSGCASAAETTSYNISEAADNFEIDRRIIFVNGITDKYLLVIEGRCSIEDEGNQLEVTCKIGEGDQYVKHFLGLSDNVTYFVEQLETAAVDAWHYRIMFRPETILPNIDVSTEGTEGFEPDSESDADNGTVEP